MKKKTYKGTILPILEWNTTIKYTPEMFRYLVKNCGVTLTGLTKAETVGDKYMWNSSVLIHTGVLSELIEETDEVLSETTEEVLDVSTIDVIQENFNEPSGASIVNIPAPFVMTKSHLEKIMAKRRTHYVKLIMKDENLSFRFFYEAQDNPHLEGYWWMVSHKDKQYIKVTEEFVHKHFSDITKSVEIVGRHHKKRGYLKIIKDLHTGEINEYKNI